MEIEAIVANTITKIQKCKYERQYKIPKGCVSNIFLMLFLEQLQTKRGRNINQQKYQRLDFIKPFGANFHFDFWFRAFVLDDECMYL